MSWWETFILIAVVHNFFGFIISSWIGSNGFEFVNPIWIYKHCYVNVFGAIFLCLLANLLCPIGSIVYWIYKLCTVGRR
jgi:hypothetical protein